MPEFAKVRTAFETNHHATGIRDPLQFYRDRRTVIAMRKVAATLGEPGTVARSAIEMKWTAEELLYASGRPYYKLYPEYVEPLAATTLDVPARYFRLPFTSMELRFPVEGVTVGTIRGIRTLLVSDATQQISEAYGSKEAYIEARNDRFPWMPPEDDLRLYFLFGVGEPIDAEQDMVYHVISPMGNNANVESYLLAGDDDNTDLNILRETLPLWRLVVALSFLITGHDRLIEPDVLSADLDKFKHATPEEVDKLHARAVRRRPGEGKGYTVGRRERLLAVARQRQAEYEEEQGVRGPLKFQHQRGGHLHSFHTKDGLTIKWIPQLTVKPELPLDPRGRVGVEVK